MVPFWATIVGIILVIVIMILSHKTNSWGIFVVPLILAFVFILLVLFTGKTKNPQMAIVSWAAAILAIFLATCTELSDSDNVKALKLQKWAVSIATLVALICSIVFFGGDNQIKAKVNLTGHLDGYAVTSGVGFKLPWQEVKSLGGDNEYEFTAADKDHNLVKLKLSLDYTVKPKSVQHILDVYHNNDGLADAVETRVIYGVYHATSNYKSADILTDREFKQNQPLTDDIKQQIQGDLSYIGVDLIDISIKDMSYIKFLSNQLS